MHVVIFCHSVLSDWNHGNAHFLRGVVTELFLRGHTVRVMEPADGWSRENLTRDHGEAALYQTLEAYPHLDAQAYDASTLDLEAAVEGADLIIVHEWSDASLVAGLGKLRARGAKWRLLFHDTHHRSVTDPAAMSAYDLSSYDGVLAFGEVIGQIYRRRGWASRVFVWHEAADVRTFFPRRRALRGDVVWIGNWGDGERSAELHRFLLEPCANLRLRARVHGVRYPAEGRAALERHGVELAGWLPNYKVPEVFGEYLFTVHIPRRPYVEQLPGIPTIRPFEAMASGIPLLCSSWNDAEGLFTPGKDFLVATSPGQMERHMLLIACDADARRELVEHARSTILRRHTCAHRVRELEQIAFGIGVDNAHPPAVGASA